MSSKRILVVDDDADIRASLTFALGLEGYDLRTAESAEEAFSVAHAFRPEVVITDLQLPGMSGLEYLERMKAAGSATDIVLITGHEDMQSAIAAMRKGAYDYLVKPLDVARLGETLGRCFRDRAAHRRLSEEAERPALTPEVLVGKSAQMIEIYKTLGRVAATRAPVLIRGETGTGKEMIARAIHLHSDAADEPFIAINCTAIPEALLESELFGHLKGSFTGAVGDRRGRFELAGRGTIFLDEIGDTSPAFQAKLLRVLQEHEFYPVGSEKPRKTEARVLAATHRPIERLIRKGEFREDLYFRLRVVEILVPPLRERREDIPRLAEHFLAKASAEMGRNVRLIPADVMRRLTEHDWPGNVREMENMIARGVVMASGPALRTEDLGLAEPAAATAPETAAASLTVSSLQHSEREQVERILEETGGNKRQAARRLGISRPRLDRLIVKYELTVPRSPVPA